MNSYKGQVSMELMGIIALILFLFIPLIYLAYSKANEVNYNANEKRASIALSQLAGAINMLSENSSMRLTLSLPKSTITYASSGTIHQLVLTTQSDEFVELVDVDVELQPSPITINEGTHTFLITRGKDKATVRLEG